MNENKHLERIPYSAGRESQTPAAGGRYVDELDQESGSFLLPNSDS